MAKIDKSRRAFPRAAARYKFADQMLIKRGK